MLRRHPSRMALVAALAALSPGPLRAQVEPVTGSDADVGGTVEARAGAIRIGPHSLPSGALGVSLRLTREVDLGAEVGFSLRPVRLRTHGSDQADELRLGHAGATLRWRPAGDAPGLRWGGSVLLGAGSARVDSPVTFGEVARENFLLVEPRIHILILQHRRLRGSVDATYRLTVGAGPIPGVPPADLRGPTVALSLQFVRHPWPQAPP